MCKCYLDLQLNTQIPVRPYVTILKVFTLCFAVFAFRLCPKLTSPCASI